MFGLLFQLAFKTLVLCLPLTIVWLAFRRLTLSKSANAWLYAATGLFALLTTLGLAPWAFNVGTSHPVFFVFTALTPAVWYGVVMLCNSNRSVSYDTDIERAFARLWHTVQKASEVPPLVLQDPHWPDAPMPVFRHTPRAPVSRPTEQRSGTIARASDATRTLLNIARSMRQNASSEHRRLKLLPPPAPDPQDLPFLKSANST